jgi:hypothetical protein
LYFNGNNTVAALKLIVTTKHRVTIDINMWSTDKISWAQSVEDTNPYNSQCQINDLKPNSDYSISANGTIIKKLKSNADGSLSFGYNKADNAGATIVEVSKL